MKCEDVQRLFSGYLDNELDPKENKLMKEHLSHCRICQEEWREFNRVVQITRSLPEIEPPSALLQRVKEGVSSFWKTKKLLTRIARPLSFRVPAWGLAAAVLLVALYLFRIFPFSQEMVKVMTARVPPSSTETEGTGITAGKERPSERLPAPGVTPHTEELLRRQREELMRARKELDEGRRELQEEKRKLEEGEYLVPGQPPTTRLPEAYDRERLPSFHSVFRGEWMDISIAGPVMTREILNMMEPDYPSWAKERGVEGTVEIMCVVLPSGEIATTVFWLTSQWPDLDQSVLQAVREWRFEPISSDEVQAGIVRIAFDFSKR